MTSEVSGAASDLPGPESPARRRTRLSRVLIVLAALRACGWALALAGAGALRDTGVIDPPEFGREKAQNMAGT